MNEKVRIISAFCLSIAILFLVGIFAYRSNEQYKSASDWVNHTQEVIAEVQALQLDILAIETAQRGYVITGNSIYLYPYMESIKTIDSSYRRLRYLVNDNPAQQLILDSIQVLMDSKIDFAKKVIELRMAENFESAQDRILTGKGEKLRNKIRDLADDFIVKEKKLLSARLVIAEKSFSFNRKLILSSILLTISIVLITMYFFSRDYNKRIRSEQKLTESEIRIKKFLESLPLGVYVLGTDGKPYYANNKSGEILGKGIMAGTTTGELPRIYQTYIAGTNTLYPADRLPVVRALNGEKNICVEDMEIDRDNTRIPLRINATNISNSKGKPEYAIAVFEDVTDIREAEKKLKEAKKLAEESSLLKEAFLANMSHEIRTPMNAILGFTDLLLKKNLGEQEKDYVQTIKTSGENLLRIINDILDVSKITSGMMTFETHPLSIRELFTSLNAMMTPRAREKKLFLSFAFDSNVPYTVLGDPTRLTQIIVNLVGNAIKFTKEGSISVFAKNLEEDASGYKVEFSVQDTGIGIPPDKLDQVFDRFTQAESHTTRHYGGTGLGLNIVKQLVELQGGTVGVRSTVGTGSVFTFMLPFKRATGSVAVNGGTETEKNIAELATRRILVVEDNPVNVKFIFSLLEEYSIKPDLAGNGKEAVEKVKSGSYDVVLMDIEMPEMNGYQATAAIRNDLKSNIPIIAMTAHAMAGEREKCLGLGMNGYISKPIRENILFETLSHITLGEAQPDKPEEESRKLMNLEFLNKAMRDRKDIVREAIEIALRQIPEDMVTLTRAMAMTDYETIRRFSHRMKSTVSLMGMSEMGITLEEMETAAGQKEDMDRIYVLFESLILLQRQAMEEMQTEKLKYTQ